MLRKLKNNNETMSMPLSIESLGKTEMEIQLMDYDYIGYATDEDFSLFAGQVYDTFCKESQFLLITYSNAMKDSVVLRKMFKFDLTGFHFNEKMDIWITPIDDKSIIFMGLIAIKTFNDLKEALRFLFSGPYDSQNIMLYSNNTFDLTKIKLILNNAIQIIKDRHGEIKNVNLSMRALSIQKENIKIFYPYGGTDFGSFMFFIF